MENKGFTLIELMIIIAIIGILASIIVDNFYPETEYENQNTITIEEGDLD